jgi:hypothetical protein
MPLTAFDQLTPHGHSGLAAKIDEDLRNCADFPVLLTPASID